MLIIGCGNRERSDDGAGILVAERLRELGIEADTRIGDAADLIEAWKGADDVILVDAVVTGAPGGAEGQGAEERSHGVERELSGVRQRARSLERRLYDGSVHNPQDLLSMQRDLAALKPRLDDLQARP